MSDWYAQHAGVATTLAGLDMTMPGEPNYFSTKNSSGSKTGEQTPKGFGVRTLQFLSATAPFHSPELMTWPPGKSPHLPPDLLANNEE